MLTLPNAYSLQGKLDRTRSHHHLINAARRELKVAKISSSYFDRNTLYIETDFSTGRIRPGFLIRFQSLPVPGAKWRVEYFNVMCIGMHTVSVVAIPSMLVSKLKQYGFI